MTALQDAARFRQMVESAGEVIFTTNLQGVFDYVNPAVFGILGYQPDEVVGRFFGDFIVPEWRHQVIGFYISQLQEQIARSSTEFPLAGRDGDERWVELTVNLLRTNDGSFSGFLGFLRDVSDRKAAEDALAEERNLLRTVIDLIPSSVYAKDTQLRYILANSAHAQTMGKESPSDLVGMDDFTLVEREQAILTQNEEQMIMRTGQPVHDRERVRLDAGSRPRWYLTSKVALHDSRGAINGIVGVSHEITERRQVEQALQDAHDDLEARVTERTAELVRTNNFLQQQMWERQRIELALQNERNLLRTLVDHLPDYVYVKDLHSRFVLANQAVAEKMGAASPDALIGRTDFDFYPPEAAAQYYGDERQVILTGRPLIDVDEMSLNIKLNKAQWVLTSKVPLHDANGNVTGIVGVGRDITSRKESEERQQEHQRFLRQLIDNNPNLIFVKDWDGCFRLVNQALADIYGTTVDAIIGKRDADFISETAAIEHYLQADRAVIETLTPNFIPEEQVFSVTTGEWRWFQTIKLPFQQADGSYHVLGIATDITARRDAEKQSLDLAVERERVRVLANFIRDASHDFRTPLSTINTSLYLLGRALSADKRQYHIEVIQRQTSHLSNLLEAMLKMSRLDSEQLFRFTQVDIWHLLKSMYDREREAAQHRRIDFSLHLTPPPFFVRADQNELDYAFSELLRNALNFTPAGKAVTISASIEDNQGVITIADTGIGIMPEDQPRIFERFFRADKARSTDKGGVGLGLSIAQKIIHAHSGRIVVESVPGNGSTFRVYLPLNPAGAPA
jgi:PAS domain S-box-containing protein